MKFENFLLLFKEFADQKLTRCEWHCHLPFIFFNSKVISWWMYNIFQWKRQKYKNGKKVTFRIWGKTRPDEDASLFASFCSRRRGWVFLLFISQWKKNFFSPWLLPLLLFFSGPPLVLLTSRNYKFWASFAVVVLVSFHRSRVAVSRDPITLLCWGRLRASCPKFFFPPGEKKFSFTSYSLLFTQKPHIWS